MHAVEDKKEVGFENADVRKAKGHLFAMERLVPETQHAVHGLSLAVDSLQCIGETGKSDFDAIRALCRIVGRHCLEIESHYEGLMRELFVKKE